MKTKMWSEEKVKPKDIFISLKQYNFLPCRVWLTMGLLPTNFGYKTLHLYFIARVDGRHELSSRITLAFCWELRSLPSSIKRLTNYLPKLTTEVNTVLSPHASLEQNWINWFKGYISWWV